MRHEPSSFIATLGLSGFLINAPEIAPELMCADALFGRAHQVNSEKPLVQRNMGVLENGSHCDRERSTASSAFIQPVPSGFAPQAIRLVNHAALRTDGTFRP